MAVAPDADQLADMLLTRHGSLAGVLRARHKDLMTAEVPPAVVEQLARISNAFALSLTAEAFDGTAIKSAGALVTYLRHDMVALTRETFRVLFLDGDNHLLADRVLWTGTTNAVQVHPREVIRAVLELGATAIILAHNHPSGSPRPSQADLRVTGNLICLCRALDVVVQDHIIVARAGIHSMRSSGDLDHLEAQLQTPASNGRQRL